jgi:hypothetical protein
MHLKTQRRRFPDGKIKEEKPRIEQIWHGFSNMATPGYASCGRKTRAKSYGAIQFSKAFSGSSRILNGRSYMNKNNLTYSIGRTSLLVLE